MRDTTTAQVADVNNARKAAGASALSVHPALTAAAQEFARDLWSHWACHFSKGISKSACDGVMYQGIGEGQRDSFSDLQGRSAALQPAFFGRL